MFGAGVSPGILTLPPPPLVYSPTYRTGWNPSPLISAPVPRPYPVGTSFCPYHNWMYVCTATTYQPIFSSQIGHTVGVVPVPPVEEVATEVLYVIIVRSRCKVICKILWGDICLHIIEPVKLKPQKYFYSLSPMSNLSVGFYLWVSFLCTLIHASFQI